MYINTNIDFALVSIYVHISHHIVVFIYPFEQINKLYIRHQSRDEYESYVLLHTMLFASCKVDEVYRISI